MKTVILAAGFGSRLWPLSTSEKPKQFQPLIEGKSPLAYTYEQLAKNIPVNELYVITLKSMQDLVFEKLPGINPHNIIVVPERRNTFPHTLWALNVITDTPDEPVLFKSVDHYMVNPDSFGSTLTQNINKYDTKNPAFTLLCSVYKSYDCNDGYCIADTSGKIVQFLEKPTKAELEAFAGENLIYRSPLVYITSRWAFLDVLGELEEPWVQHAKKVVEASDASIRQQAFLAMPVLDISHAIFQKSHRLYVGVIEYEYIDVGQFTEIYALNSKDSLGNVVNGNVILGTECRNCLIINKLAQPLVVMSLTDTVVVQTQAGSLISPLKDASKVGEIFKNQIHGQ